jgi:hypothetical protein
VHASSGAAAAAAVERLRTLIHISPTESEPRPLIINTIAGHQEADR